MIYVVSQWYLPVNNPPANRMGQVVRVLVEQYGADQVRVVTGRPNYPDGILAPEFRWRCFTRKTGAGGETIDHLYEWPAPFLGIVKKMSGYLTFAFSVFCYFVFRRMKKEDLIYVTSGPTFPAYAIRWLSGWKRNLRYVMDVRDLWPQAVAASGGLKEGSLGYRWMEAQTNKAYRRAERMVGNSDGIAEFISGVIAPKECLLLYNPVDGKLFRPAKVDGFRPDLFGDSDRTTFLFYGSLAFYNDLMLVMRALKRLSEEGKQFRFIFIGDGDARPEMLDFVAKHGLEEQVVFLPFVDKPDLVQYINAADFGCASVKNTPNLKYMLPTKIPEFLACNTYVVGLVHEPLAGILRDRGVAHIAEPGNEDQLVEHLSDLIENGNPLKGDEARACWEDRFSLKPFEQRVLKLVEDVQNQQA